MDVIRHSGVRGMRLGAVKFGTVFALVGHENGDLFLLTRGFQGNDQTVVNLRDYSVNALNEDTMVTPFSSTLNVGAFYPE